MSDRFTDYEIAQRRKSLHRAIELKNYRQTMHQQIADRYDYKKEYYHTHKEQIQKSQRKYYLNNKDKFRRYCRTYYYKNKDRIQNYFKEYYNKNKKKINMYYRQYYKIKKQNKKLEEYKAYLRTGYDEKDLKEQVWIDNLTYADIPETWFKEE